MGKRTVVAMPGDGIGKVVLDEAIRVLESAGFCSRLCRSRYWLGILVY